MAGAPGRGPGPGRIPWHGPDPGPACRGPAARAGGTPSSGAHHLSRQGHAVAAGQPGLGHLGGAPRLRRGRAAAGAGRAGAARRGGRHRPGRRAARLLRHRLPHLYFHPGGHAGGRPIRHPGIVTLFDIGDGWETLPGGGHRDLWAARVAGQPGQGKPAVLFMAAIHAREIATPEVALALLSLLADGYGADPLITYLVNERETWIVPMANPDGHIRAESGMLVAQEREHHQRRCDPTHCWTLGIDLNRNFDDHWGGGAVAAATPATRPIGGRALLRAGGPGHPGAGGGPQPRQLLLRDQLPRLRRPGALPLGLHGRPAR